MATDFIMPRLPDHQKQQQHYQQQIAFQQPSTASHTTYTPQISPLSTSGNTSPISPKNYIQRQKRPNYMPAVLRPTEFPSKAPPPRPKAATGDGEEEETAAMDRTLRPNTSFISLGAATIGRLSRRSTGDSGKCVDGGGDDADWNLDLFPKPTGTPTRKHWKPDQESAVCDHATCKKYFSTFTRRHHCRKCGNIFCDSHSGYYIPLDQDANYNPRGIPSRACPHCYSQFKEWRSRTNSQASSSVGSADGNNNTAGGEGVPRSPIVTSPTTAANMRLPITPDAAHSVPRDWNWSTF
ncbi:hypothetical protein B0H66DRAFT_353163 [Apodospora peruviana]|uniref:FYVE-type domain-containing protein n=1 Tax=Apodospora peruviana TaxID=516989 RepID=A0AAE0HWX9_9PEZI|nr:hypothetical protein B0H66DRAFT_353163 [Apodospora peruviana]